MTTANKTTGLDMQAAAQKSHEALLLDLWKQAHPISKAGGVFNGTGSPEIDARIVACWGPWDADKPYKQAWNGGPPAYVVPDPSAGPIGGAVAVATGLRTARGRRDADGCTKWGREVTERAYDCGNLPERFRPPAMTRLTLAKLIWARCVSLQGENSGGSKTLVGHILDELCGGRAEDPATPGKGGRPAAKVATTDPSYLDPGLRYWEAK